MPTQEPFKIQHGPYQIERFPPRHPLPKRYPLATEYIGLVTEFIWAAYMALEWLVVLSLQLASSEWLWKVWLLLFAEAAASISEISSFLNTMFILLVERDTAGPRPSYRLVGDVAPLVDIMIPCCGEDVYVIMDTVKAVLAIDYPSDKFRVFVLDDGKDDVLREAVETWNKKTCSANPSRLHYLSRPKKPGQKSHYKSGNLQYGIEETARMGGSAYLASLDADMIPGKDWLRAIVPHLILEDDLALACPPQVSSRPFGHEIPLSDFLALLQRSFIRPIWSTSRVRCRLRRL